MDVWKEGGASYSPSPNYVKLDLFTTKNESSDNVIVSDDGGETNQELQSESTVYIQVLTRPVINISLKNQMAVL